MSIYKSKFDYRLGNLEHSYGKGGLGYKPKPYIIGKAIKKENLTGEEEENIKKGNEEKINTMDEEILIRELESLKELPKSEYRDELINNIEKKIVLYEKAKDFFKQKIFKPKIFDTIKPASIESNIEKSFDELEPIKKDKKLEEKNDMGKAYEKYTYDRRNKPSYKKISENMGNIKYSKDNYSLYDAEIDNNDGTKTIIEDKNYYTYSYPKGYNPSFEYEGKIIPYKPISMSYEKLDDDTKYNKAKDDINDLKKEYNKSTDENEKDIYETEIKNLLKNIGIKIQLSKFKGYQKFDPNTNEIEREVIPYFNKEHGKIKLNKIYDTGNFEPINGDIIVKTHLKEGEFIYNLTNDRQLKKNIIEGTEFFTLDPKKYIIDGKWVFIPKSKFTKI